MKKRTRTIFFSLCITCFILVAPITVFYSQGYRFDFETKQIVQTGALYLKVQPRNTEIYLNGKFKKNTSVFTSSVLIENLLPKNYQIEVRKRGYHTWKKNLKIKEKQVTEANNIVLLPENLNFLILSQNQQEIAQVLSQLEVRNKEIPKELLNINFKGFEYSPDQEKIVYFSNSEIWLLYLKEKAMQPEIETSKKHFLTRFSEEINKVYFLTNHYLVFNTGDKIKIIETDTRDKLNLIHLAEFKNPEIFWDKNKLYILSQNTLYFTDKLLP